MRRNLSQLLITVLVLICPLTFSTDRVPDFQTTCVIESALAKKGMVAVAAVRCSRESSPPPYRNRSRHSFTPRPSPSAPSIGWFQPSFHGRAPPAAFQPLS